MKAFEWAARFAKEDRETVLNDFALETRDLADKRSEKSKDKYKKSAVEGAVREQRQKFLAVCGRVEGLTNEMFDDMMRSHLADLMVKQSNQEEETDGRELIRSVQWDAEQTVYLKERLGKQVL